MAIRPDQLTAYDDASKAIEKAAKLVEDINVARMDYEACELIQQLLYVMHCARHAFHKDAHDCFLRERGLKEPS